MHKLVGCQLVIACHPPGLIGGPALQESINSLNNLAVERGMFYLTKVGHILAVLNY